jgi:hypothetical protein
MLVVYASYDYGVSEWQRFGTGHKINKGLCYSVAMYFSYDMVVEVGKYAKMYEFSHHMHPQTALGSMS